jgi:hypothetical protein
MIVLSVTPPHELHRGAQFVRAGDRSIGHTAPEPALA